MILDNSLMFTGTSNGASSGITDGANTDAPTASTQNSSNIIDLGIVGGLPPSSNGGGARDIGTCYPLKILVQVTTAFEDGASLQVALHGAPDDGSGSPDTYAALVTGEAILEANLVVGARLLEVDVPRPGPGVAIPRFLKLVFVSSGTHTVGSVIGTMVLDRNDQPSQAAGYLGGYPVGLTVDN